MIAEGLRDSESGVFAAEEVYGVGDKGSGHTPMAKLEAFSQDFKTWDNFPKLPNYQDFRSTSIQIKEIVLCYYKILLYLIVLNSPHSGYHKM